METQSPRSQSALQQYSPNSQSRTSKFFQKVSNLKVRIRFSSSTTRNPKDLDTPTNHRAAGNGRGGLNLFHNPYPSQGQLHTQHRRTPSADTYTYDGTMKPYMSQPSMLGNMIVEPFVPNSTQNGDDEGDDADSMHIVETPTQTPTQTRRFPFGRQKNSSQRSISQGLLPATGIVVGAAQAQSASRTARRSGDVPDGLPTTQTGARPRTASQPVFDGLPRSSQPPIRPPSQLSQVSNAPSHNQVHAQIRTPPARPSQDTHRTTPSIVISDPSESFDNGVSGTAAAQHNYHQDQEKDAHRPRSSLGSGDYSGLGTNANARSATPDFHANPHAHPLANSYIPSHGRPSSSRSTASTSNTGSISVNGHERVTRPSAPRRPSSTKSSGSEVSYVSAVSQLVDAMDNADSKVSGSKGMTNASHVIGQPHVHEQVSTSAVALPQVPAPTRSSSDATILASASSASDHINGLVSGRSSSPLPPRKDSLPMAPPATTTSTSTTPSKRPRPPSRPLPPPPPSEDGDVKGCSELSQSHVSSHPPLDTFTFPTASAQDSPRPPSSYVIHEEPQQSPASIQSARPTLKQRTSSSSLKRVGQAITRKLSIGKLRKDSGSENDRRPSITSPSRQPQPPLPNLNLSVSANDVPAISTMAPTPTSDLATDTPISASPASRTPPPRLTLPTYSHRFSLTTFTGGAITFSNDDTGTPTLEVPTSPGGTNLSWAAGGAARLSPSVILRPPPLPIKNLPRLPTVQGLGSFHTQGSTSGSGGRTIREGSDATVTPKVNDAGRVRLRSMPELLLTGPSRRGTMEDEQEESDDDDDMMSDEEDEDEDGRPRRSEDRAGTALSNYTVSSFDHDDDTSSHSHSYSADLPDSGRPSMSSYAGSTLLVPPSTSPTRRRKGGKTHSRSSSYNFDASSVEDSPTSHRSSLGSEEQQSPGAEGKGKGKERRMSGARPALTVMTEPIRAKPLRSPTLDLTLGDGLDIGYILAATEQAEQNILGEEPTVTSNRKDLKGKGRMQEAPTPVDDDDAIDTGRTPTASGLSSGKSYYQDYFSSKQVPPPLPADAADIKAKHSQTQPTTPRVPPPPSPARTPRLEDTIRGSARFSVGMPPLPGAGLVSRPSIYKHASRSMIDFHALAVKEERDRMVKEEEERQEKEERARRRKSVRRSAAMLGDNEPLQHAFAAFEGGAIPEDGVAPEPKRVSRVVENAADGVLARDRSSIVGPKQNRFSKAPPYEAVLEALKAEGREEPQLAGMPLRRRRSLPTFNANTEPPPYPSFFPRGGARIEPRDDEGQERLPAYYNHIYMCGVVPRKMEFVAAGQQAKDRKWRKVVCVLEGTSFKIYKYRPHGGAIGEWFRSKKNSSSANLPTGIAKEDSTSSTTSRNKLGEREEGQVVELKDFPNTSRPDTPVTPTRAQPRLARDSPASSSSNVASGSRVNAGPSSNNRSRLGNLLGRSHNRSQSEATSNFLTPARSPRPSLNLPSSSSDSSGFPSGNSFGEASSQHLSVPGSSPAPSTRPTTPSSFMSNQRSPSRAETRHSISSDEEPHNPHHTTIIGVGTAGGTGPLQAPTETGELLKEYSMQHAESGLGNDYIKRTNVIRVRLEGEQFLIQANNTMEVVAWIEALQAAANIALDLDERPMPKGPLFPRRRRRRRRVVTETDSGPADANHTPIMVDTT